MHVVFAGMPEETPQLEETGNMQVGRINLGALANFFTYRTHLRGLFWHFFHSKLQTDGYFAIQGYLGVS
jgi:hypothetical protein